jgi:hypothetical protein
MGTSSAYAQGTNSQYIAGAWSPTYAKTMGLIKKALDPNGIMPRSLEPVRKGNTINA